MCIYVSDFFNKDGEFIQVNDFNVNLPFTIILGLKRVLCLFSGDRLCIESYLFYIRKAVL